MNNMPADTNRRVLVIDDNAAIHDDFRKILSPRTAEALDATEAAVFGSAPDAVRQTRFEVDSAYQGSEGLLAVKNHVEATLPYAMAFVDVRMPRAGTASKPPPESGRLIRTSRSSFVPLTWTIPGRKWPRSWVT